MEIPVSKVHRDKVWASKPPSVGSSSTGAVQEVKGKSTRTILATMPRASLDDQVSAVGRQWLSTMTLELANRDPVFATNLMFNAKRGSPADCINTPDWDTKNHMLRMHEPVLRSIIDEVSSLVPQHALLVHLNTVFAIMGATGFRNRAHDSSGDAMHKSMSFFGTMGARLGLACAIGRSMLSLRHNTPTGYSSVAVAPGRNTKRTLAKVIRAQWRTAAARRQIRCDEAAARQFITPQLTQQNYEASFLRLAAELLSNTGTMDMSLLYSGLVTKAIASIGRHLGEGTKGEMFDDLMDASGMEFETKSADLASAEMSIATACNIAREVDPSVDADSIVAAFRAVTRWVAQDIAGSHVVAAATERRTSMFPSRPQSVQLPSRSIPNKDSELVIIDRITVGEAETPSLDEVEFHMLYQFAHRKAPDLHESVTGLKGHNDAYKLLKNDADLREKYRELFAATGMEYIEPEFSVFDVIRDGDEDFDADFVQE